MLRKVSVAPMMDCTDRHDRFFLRLISKNVMLYSEMIVAEAIKRGDKKSLLNFNIKEKPLALQIGGSSPKILGESGFLNYSKKYDFNSTVIRYHNVYGPRMGFKHVIPHLAERFLKKESPFKIYGPKQTRSFCYIDDAVIGTVQAMESEKSKGEIFHIGSKDEISIETLTKKAGVFFNYSGNYVNAEPFPGSTHRRCPDISKAKTYFNYKPKVSWQDGLKKTLGWYKVFFENNKTAFESSFKPPPKNDFIK